MYSYITSIITSLVTIQARKSQIMTTKLIKETPFQVVETDDNKVYVVLGNKAVLQCETKEEALKKVKKRDYELLFNAMYLIKETNFNEYETKTKENA